MNVQTESTIEKRLIKALGHPLRQRILEKLNEREGSPSRLAEALDEPLGNVSYHVRVLLDCDAIELVGTRPVRGTLEHTYRAITRPYLGDEHWARLPASVRRSLFDKTLQQIWEHAVEGAEEGGFDHPRTHVSWVALDLDSEGYQQVAELLTATLERVLEIQAEAAGRLTGRSDTDGETARTELALLHYHRPRAGTMSGPEQQPEAGTRGQR